MLLLSLGSLTSFGAPNVCPHVSLPDDWIRLSGFAEFVLSDGAWGRSAEGSGVETGAHGLGSGGGVPLLRVG